MCWLAVALVALFAGSCPIVAADASAEYHAVQAAFLREDFSTAAQLAQPFLTRYPVEAQRPRVWIWLALSLDRLQRSDDALQAFDQLEATLEENDPLWPEVLYWDGEASRHAFRLSRAAQAFRRVLDHDAASSWALQARMGLGLIQMQQQEFASAIESFHALATQEGAGASQLDARFFEGVCRVRLGQLEEALAIFLPLLEQLRDPQFAAQAAFYLGESYTGLHRPNEALGAYEQAIASAPSSKWAQLAQFGLGWSYYSTGRCRESVEALSRYLAYALPDHRTDSLFAQGSCYAQLGQERDATSRFEQIVSRDPASPLAVESGLLLIDAYRRNGRAVLAGEILRLMQGWSLDALARARVALRAGSMALERGDTLQAQRAFTLSSRVDRPSIQQAALTGLGDVQMWLGDVPAAANHYQQAMAVAPSTPEGELATYQFGRAQLQAGAFEEAASLFARVMSSRDRSLANEARLALALVLLNQHEPARARSMLDALRQENPQAPIRLRAGYYLALLELDDGDQASAQRLCEELVAQAPSSEEALQARLLLADLAAQRDSVDAAVALLRDAYAATDVPVRHRAQLALRLGDVARTHGHSAEAIHWYEAASDVLPVLAAEATYRIASCLEEAGDLPRAKQWYGVIDRDPWRVRGQLALARLLEREDHLAEAQAIYERLATAQIPEADAIRERLATP